jgi:ATP-dependent DNA helicase UvrD/PcrA
MRSEPWLDGLTEEQRRAVLDDADPLAILAGAGTGKTRTLVSRVARLVAAGTPPDRVLLLTFTRRAATEMLARAARLVPGGGSGGTWGGTFHAVAHRLLRVHGARVGLRPGFTILDAGDATDLLALLRTEHGVADGRNRFPRAAALVDVASRVVNAQQPLGETLRRHFPWCATHEDAIRTLLVAYNERKRAANLVDYDDLLLYWRALLLDPEAGPLVRERFDHVLVDEFQDTNAVQVDLLRHLCPPGGPTLTAVGDDAQAIYGFRSATATNLTRFAEAWPGARLLTLEQSHRCTPAILAVANAVMSEADDVLPRTLWSTRPAGARPALVTCHDEAAQSTAVCERILELREDGFDLAEQAVLFRSSHHADQLELELATRDIPFVKYGGLKFLEAAHVKDLLALLRVLDNPTDAPAWHRVLGMVDGVGRATTRKVLTHLGLDSAEAGDPRVLARFLTDDLPVPARAAAGLDDLRLVLADCGRPDAGDERPPSEQIDRLLAWCDDVFPTRYGDAAARLGDLEAISALAARHHHRGEVLAELTLDPPVSTSDLAGRPHLDDDVLTLSTIHSAKGLEWRAVHVIHATEGNLPNDLALHEPGGLAEERRLLYVAVTRARDELSIHRPLRYHHHRHALDDRHGYAAPSRFLRPALPHLDEQSAGPVAGIDPTEHVPGADTVTGAVLDLLSR